MLRDSKRLSMEFDFGISFFREDEFLVKLEWQVHSTESEDNSYVDSDDLFSVNSEKSALSKKSALLEEPENIMINDSQDKLYDIEHLTADLIDIPVNNRINFSEVFIKHK